ncbi:MAG: hypothetical protein NVSMB3_15440 [Acidobacteriaceae bacterium]
MRIGFIGVGGVAQPHLQNVSQTEGVQVAAVCDLVEERAKSAAEKFGAKAYSDYKEMIRTEKLDGCYVCVIPGAHGTIELELVEARLPMYVEKPVHMDLDAADRVVKAIEKAGLVNGVGYHWRYTEPSQAGRDFAAAHRVSLVEGWWYGGMPGAPWWRQMKLSGGQLVEQTTHIVDMARFLAGEVKSVFASGSTGAMTDVENYDIHDTSVCILEFESGAIGQITSGCIAEQHGGSRVDINVKGRNWSANVNPNKAVLKDASGEKVVESPQSWQEQLGNGDQSFLKAIRSGSQAGVLSPYVSGAQTAAVTLAANESMQTGQRVKVRRFL